MTLAADLLADIEAAEQQLDRVGAAWVNLAADALRFRDKPMTLTYLRRARARGTDPERALLDPLIERARTILR